MLSVIIIVKNEAEPLRRCLESVQWADEIVVLDSGSTDNTLDVAKAYTENVFSTDWQGYGIQKGRALRHATHDWVLNLDADEVVSSALKEAIQAAIKSSAFDAYRIPIQMVFYDKPMRYSSSPSRHIRLYKRAGAQYSDDYVHEKITLPVQAKVSQLTQPMLHYCYRDLSHAISKFNRYSSYSANIKRTRGKTISFARTIGASSWMFFRCFVLQRGFMDGRPGFVLATFNAIGTLLRGLKQIYPDHN